MFPVSWSFCGLLFSAIKQSDWSLTENCAIRIPFLTIIIDGHYIISWSLALEFSAWTAIKMEWCVRNEHVQTHFMAVWKDDVSPCLLAMLSSMTKQHCWNLCVCCLLLWECVQGRLIIVLAPLILRPSSAFWWLEVPSCCSVFPTGSPNHFLSKTWFHFHLCPLSSIVFLKGLFCVGF